MRDLKWSELEVGLKAEFQVEVTQEMMVNFGKISGDYNPLHCDISYAETRGFSNVVVYGLLTTSFYSRLVGMDLPGVRCLLQGIDVKFVKPVFVGDTLSVSGKISYLNDSYKQAEIEAEIRNTAGEKISRAKIKVGVYE